MASLRPISRALSRRISAVSPTSTTTTSYSTKSRCITYLQSLPPKHQKTNPHRQPQSYSSHSLFSTTSTKSQKHNEPEHKPTDPDSASGIPPSKIYTYEQIKTLSENPSPHKILVDVREPSELLGTGKIPTAVNVPISSAADSFFLSEQEFEDRFGFARPTDKDEVVFYCKAGVRSRAAARLAGQAGFGGKIGEFPGSWVEWFEKGGKVEHGQ